MRIEPVTLSVEDVRKTYPNGIEAVRDISLEVRPGEVFGLVGPNGAGKTTLLKLISGLLYPERGTVLCGNVDVTSRPKLAARYVGLMPDPLGVYTDISARDYLEFFARILEIPPGERGSHIDRAVDLLELEPWLNEEVETLSAGWQRRLALGRILLTDAPILLLDEPAAGLDISARSELLRIVRKLAETQRTLIVSSHILPELQQLADRFGIISKGQWVDVAPDQVFFSREELASGLGTRFWELRCNDPESARKALGKHDVELVDAEQPFVRFKAEDEAAGAAALKHVVKAGVEVYEFRQHEMELSELVLKTLEGNGGDL
jgi:ABC-2 type transport system ATP-binding protein